MTAASPTPAQLAATAAREFGAERFAAWCAGVLTGEIDFESLINNSELDRRWLVDGPWTHWGPAESWVERGLDYWPRVWAARSLLHQWHPVAETAIAAGLQDDHWRVREMCAKVAAKQELGTAADTCAQLAVRDDNHRVRIATLRVVGVAGEAEHMRAVTTALTDNDHTVRQAAEVAQDRLTTRLERTTTQLLDDLDPDWSG